MVSWFRKQTDGLKKGEKTYVFIASIIFILLVVLAAKYYPLGEESHFVVRLKDGSYKIAISPGDSFEQDFSSPIQKIKGVVLYSNKEIKDINIAVYIVEKNGNEVVRQGDIKKHYLEARTDVFVRFDPENLKKNQKYVLRINNLGDDAVEFWGRDLGESKKPLAFSILEPVPLGVRKSFGAIVGAVFFSALLFVWFFFPPKRKTIYIIILLAFVTPFVLGGLWEMQKFGISDWDFYSTTHNAYRKTMVEEHVFPLWEPYTAGGTSAIGDPEFSVLSPLFLLELVFGTQVGMRLSVMTSVFVGGLGMYILSRKIRLSALAGVLVAIAYMFGGVNLLEIIEGHVNIYMAMWLPWIFWAWLEMIRGKRGTLKCSIFLALTFLGGGIYLLMYTAIAFIGLSFFTKHPINNLFKTLKAGLWAMGFAAIKLVPVFLWVRQYPDASYASSVNILPWLKQIFLERLPHGTSVIFQQGGGWHEYGAYVGYFLLVLAIIGLLKLREERLVKILLVATVVAILVAASGPLLKQFFDIFPFMPRSNISRFVLFAVIPIVLLSGYGFDFISSKGKIGKSVGMLFMACIAIDLMSYSYLLSRQAFVVEPFFMDKRAEYPLEFTADPHYATITDTNGDDVKYSRSYGAFLSGYGSTNFPSVLGPEASVRTIEDDKSSYLELEKGLGTVKLISWNPNTIVVETDVREKDTLIVNSNYAPGWYANNKSAREVAGRMAVSVSPGVTKTVFRFYPQGFILGLAISVTTIFAAIVFGCVIRKRN